MGSSKKSHETREFYVRTRREWKDGSKVEIEFTSEVKVDGKLDHVSNYMVTLHHEDCGDRCTCMGFGSSERAHPGSGTCCHIEHFRLVEGYTVAIHATCRRLLVAEQPVQSLESVVAILNLVEGKGTISVGASAIPVPPAKDLGQMTIKQSRDREWERRMEELPAPVVKKRSADMASLNGSNRGFSLLKRSA